MASEQMRTAAVIVLKYAKEESKRDFLFIYKFLINSKQQIVIDTRGMPPLEQLRLPKDGMAINPANASGSGVSTGSPVAHIHIPLFDEIPV